MMTTQITWLGTQHRPGAMIKVVGYQPYRNCRIFMTTNKSHYAYTGLDCIFVHGSGLMKVNNPTCMIYAIRWSTLYRIIPNKVNNVFTWQERFSGRGNVIILVGEDVLSSKRSLIRGGSLNNLSMDFPLLCYLQN